MADEERPRWYTWDEMEGLFPGCSALFDVYVEENDHRDVVKLRRVFAGVEYDGQPIAISIDLCGDLPGLHSLNDCRCLILRTASAQADWHWSRRLQP